MRLRYISVVALIAEAGGDPWAIGSGLDAGRPAQVSDLAQAFHAAGRCTAESNTAFEDARRRFAASWNREDGGRHPINDSAEVQRAIKSLGAQSLQLPKIGVHLENIAAALAQTQRAGGMLLSTLQGQLEQLDTEIGHTVALDNDTHLLEQQAIDGTKSALGQLESLRDDYSEYLQRSSATLHADGYDPTAIEPADTEGQPERIEIPPPTTDPEDVKRWWNSLSQQQRDQLVSRHPPGLGNLNGIDTVSRDRANQAVMNDDVGRIENVAAQEYISVEQVIQHPERYGLPPAAVTRYTNAMQTRDGLGIDSGGGRNPVFLRTYDPEAFEGRGREAIAIGNPDKADNTTVLVPGTGSSVRDGYLTHRDGLHIHDEARKADPGKTIAVLVWMGYHTPDSPLDLQIEQTTLARDGGALLARDVNALGVTHGPGATHVTVIGHSYGSTTVADAAAGSGMRANDVVLVGCPGTDLAHSAADFHLATGGHVYVGAASTDPVTHFGGIQERLPGTGVTVGLGDDPAVEGYGSTRFKAEAPGLTFPLNDHSSYFTPGNESLFSIADIASGHGDALARDDMTAEHRGSFWLPEEFDPESLRVPTRDHYH